MIRIAICENEGEGLKSLQDLLETSDEAVSITVYKKPEPLLWDVKTDRIYFDIFFVDDTIDKLNGFEIAKHIKLIDENAIIIFLINNTTDYKDAQRRVSFGYLIKPVNNLQFERIFYKAAERVKQVQTQVFSSSHLGHTHGIRHASITYISNENNKILIHLRSKEARQYSGAFSDFISLLENRRFVRCHRNYIVNLSSVTAYDENEFYLDDVHIPISKKYLSVALASYNRHLFAIFEQD